MQEFERVDFPADRRAPASWDRLPSSLLPASLPILHRPSAANSSANIFFARSSRRLHPASTLTSRPTMREALTNRERLQLTCRARPAPAVTSWSIPSASVSRSSMPTENIATKKKVVILSQRSTRPEAYENQAHRISSGARHLGLYQAAFPHSEFSTPARAGRVLACEPACQKCVVKQLFRYALGRPETAADQPEIDRSDGRFRNSQFRFQRLIIAIITSQAFPGGGS